MTSITAFDSKDFKRSNKVGELKFFSPLGCGVKITKQKEFIDLYNNSLHDIFEKFNVSSVGGCLSSSEYFALIGPGKTYKISDELLQSVQDLIESVYITYVILPSAITPTVAVGGYQSPKVEIPTFDFLRKLSGYFSYIAAWNYLGIESRKKETIVIDGFNGKRTPAWDDIIAKTTPIVMPHGDECNPLISTADVIAALTDKKLWDNFMHLNPENVIKIWNDYPFKVETHFIDAKLLSKIKWYSNEHINLSDYYGKPTIFVKADGYNSTEIKKLSAFPDATILAQKLNGCVQGFDKAIDSSKVRNGDIFIYAGKEAQATALTLQDMCNLEVIPFKKIREKI
jgi:hypothetical protein